MNDEGFRIGDVASAAGVSVDTVRHYEKRGLIDDVVRDSGGYRRFGPNAIRRVLVVRRAVAIGFTLDELERIFRRRRAGQAPCRSVRELAGEKLRDLDARIAALEELRVTLAGIVDGWDERLDAANGGIAHLLESLVP